jgi:hypothetical protein
VALGESLFFSGSHFHDNRLDVFGSDHDRVSQSGARATLYAVYDLTNYSLIKDWSLKLSFADMA